MFQVITRFCFSYVFLLNTWLSLTKGSRLHINGKPINEALKNGHVLFPELIKHKVFDSLLSLSIIMRPTYTRFTRTQRLFSLAAMFALSMLSSAMWYNSDAEEVSHSLHIGPISLNYKQIFVGIMASLISVPPMIIVILSFQNYKKKRKMGDFLGVLKSQDSGTIPWCFCVFAWILVVGILLSSSFVIFMYSLQWGGDVAQEWLASISFGLIFDSVVGPVKVSRICE